MATPLPSSNPPCMAPLGPTELEQRIVALRSVIEAAEAKRGRMDRAITERRQALALLEARQARASSREPALHANVA